MPRAIFRAADFGRHGVTIDEVDLRSSERASEPPRARDGPARAVPAIVLTAVATDEAREASSAAGGQRFMTTPAFPEGRLAAVEALIGSAVGSASSSEIRASRSTRARTRSSGADLR